MPLSIEYKNPDFPDGVEFDIGGILVVNGEATSVSEEDELRYVSRRRVAVRDGLANSTYASVSGDAFLPPSKVADMYPQVEEEAATPVAVLEEVAASEENAEDDEGGD